MLVFSDVQSLCISARLWLQVGSPKRLNRTPAERTGLVDWSYSTNTAYLVSLINMASMFIRTYIG